MARINPVSPPNVEQAIEGRVGAHRVLCYDVGSRKSIGRFYLTRSDGSEGVGHVEFTVNGHKFVRRTREVQVGNFGCTWVRIGGQDYQLHES
jgi:hypothetical protein